MERRQNSPQEINYTSRLQPRRRVIPNVDVNNDYYHQASSPSGLGSLSLGRASLIRPHTAFARAVIMGNEASSPKNSTGLQSSKASRTTPTEERPMSNLSVLMNQHQHREASAGIPVEIPVSTEQSLQDEADYASGPPAGNLVSSAPTVFRPSGVHRPGGAASSIVRVAPPRMAQRSLSSGGVGGIGTPPSVLVPLNDSVESVRRCMSSKELGTLAPPSGSPYANMLAKKEELETSMRIRLQTMRESLVDDSRRPPSAFVDVLDESSSSSRRKEGANESRNRRRAAHNQAVVNDLCDVVADLFIAESKLLKPMAYGVSDHSSSQFQLVQVVKSIHNFVSALPTRYALGADTPSEVLLHMRLMAAARADSNKAVVHIHNLEGDTTNWSRTVVASGQTHNRLLRLVTIACNDVVGLLEYITKLLATGGSRVLDADVMLSTDGIVLDRFVVEMSGRLRLDMLANLIEAFLKGADAHGKSESETSPATPEGEASPLSSSSSEQQGPLYYRVPRSQKSDGHKPRSIREEMQCAVPLTDVLTSSYSAGMLQEPYFPKLRRMHSMPLAPVATPSAVPNIHLPMRRELDQASIWPSAEGLARTENNNVQTTRERRPLVNRRAAADLDLLGPENEPMLDYVTIPNLETVDGAGVEDRAIPLIPFDELMLIETLGSGRVSTIYRAAWQHPGSATEVGAPEGVQIVALKVAMVNAMTGDTSHVDELRWEADIAARLKHPNICDLVGVAADSECFCLATDYCEGGSLLSLLVDTSRYYEYLPIAMDIANGMAYLHSRNVIHRDLKPSNILLTRDHRAKIADFGMSCSNAGQELTAETGTYRYMAPEVIRHESYSSNADVYSFGICLWQLITREIPFATMTPIQAAYTVAEGRRPPIPPSTPRRLQEIILACWDQDSHKRPSFTYIAMALADYAKMAFSPANVGTLTLQIANEMLANVEGNSTVNVDFSTSFVDSVFGHDSVHSNVGLEIE